MLPPTAEQIAYHNARLKELFEPFGFIVDEHMVAPMPFGKERLIDCSMIDTTDITTAMPAFINLVHDKGYHLGVADSKEAVWRIVADPDAVKRILALE